MSSGSSDSSGASSGSSGASSAQSSSGLPSLADGAGNGKKIVYIPGLTGVAFYSSVSCGADAEAKRLGASFETQGDPTFAVDKQTAVLNAVVATKPDAIMISITDPKAMIAPLLKAKNAGIKIIGIDGDLDDKSVMSTNIQSDNLKGGALAADRLGEVIGGKGTVITVDNQAGSHISDDRFNGFKDEMTKKYPNVKVLDRQFSGNSADKAASIVKASIANDSTVTGVYTLETLNTQGAATGVQQSGKSGQVHIVGYDTSDPIIAAIKAKQVDGTVAQFPLGEGTLGVDSAITLLNGGSVPRDQETPFLMVTPDNVDSAEAQKYIYKVDC
ncbi:LacI family transcriptional regulator [Nakamurella endophytica]|uniref:LacI family transcriptional regulator n=2 Tax=Nakamurella endophytica TaxID=1748367 RepID=A0A917T0E9_9ACTN|nr:LacI family transcriptional regulator [Nakamurella endophytica]